MNKLLNLLFGKELEKARQNTINTNIKIDNIEKMLASVDGEEKWFLTIKKDKIGEKVKVKDDSKCECDDDFKSDSLFESVG